MREAIEARAARVLLVEANEDQALEVRKTLHVNGFQVALCASAEEALESLSERLPDLVIADHQLPGMNGDELARQMRLNMHTRAIPIIMLTETRERSREREGLESGADAYVQKSAEHDLILLRIRALLRRRLPSPTESNDSSVFRRTSILIIDDSAIYPAFLHDLLSREGYDVTLASHRAEGVDLVSSRSASWDCIIVNIRSPNFDGVELCRQLNTYRGAASLPDMEAPSFYIVGLGNDEGGQVLSQAFAAGADDVIPATVDKDVLRVRIRALVRRKLVQDENARIEAELRQHELAVERARAEAVAAQTRASFVGALAQANTELEQTNHKLRETQGRLVQAAKMASLGELVAGIAHEINNPLAFIAAHQGTVEKLLGEFAARVPPEVGLDAKITKSRERLNAMKMGLERIQDLVVNLRRFSRLEEGSFQTINVSESIETVLTLLAPKLGNRIAVRRRYDATPELYCLPALLNQVVMNIVSNAADAIEDSGTIEIETTNDDEAYTIVIGDSGPGVPHDLRERIFEPFFTTKPVGTGTGLGLAIAYSVVQAHDGSIRVTTGPEGGARFTIMIPRRNVE